MNVVEKWAEANKNFDRGKMQVEKLVVHSPGTAQPDADKLFEYYNNPAVNALPHAFLERSGRVLEVMPWDNVGAHVGAGPKGGWNGLSIGVEVCEPAGHTYLPNSGTMVGYDVKANAAYFADIYEQAIQLFVYLCERYGLTERDIYCHAEVHRLGYGSNHIDIEHWWPKHGKNMDTFRADVGARLRGESPAQPDEEYGPGMYQVIVPDLTIRKGPGTNYEETGHITDEGAYTVIEIQNGYWGRLKSGAGWISVYEKYCRKLSSEQEGQEKLPAMVKVKEDLNIRSGPGTDYPVLGVIRDQGSYTVVQTSAGNGADLWGKLKSGAGWIALGGDFTSQPQ